ncbi:MAG: disulfide bond formation protein B [Proteobacteria bacterium]|jgi:disulfide bond formation protein DsbB|nr:disulfide bond formation protein B [Pseudomonadota bacterium]MDA1301011.1 disulfide bond formation protein B [Pseudomonadota bacterium]
MTLPSSRWIFWLIAVGSAGVMAGALFMQYQMALEPCPLCILQRVMVIAAGAIALVAAIHHPGETGIRVYGTLVVLMSIIGGAISTRQLWLQSLPPDEVPACGPGLDYLLDVFPLTEVLAKVLSGDGSCAEVLWTLFGISIPGWALLGFIGLAALGLLQMLRPEV